MSTADPVSWKDFTGAAALLLFSVVGLATLALSPSNDNTAAIMLRPGTGFAEAADVVSRAGGVIVRTGGFDNIVIAYAQSPDFHDRLYKAGAWLVANPWVLGGCTSTPSIQNSQNEK